MASVAAAPLPSSSSTLSARRSSSSSSSSVVSARSKTESQRQQQQQQPKKLHGPKRETAAADSQEQQQRQQQQQQRRLRRQRQSLSLLLVVQEDQKDQRSRRQRMNGDGAGCNHGFGGGGRGGHQQQSSIQAPPIMVLRSARNQVCRSTSTTGNTIADQPLPPSTTLLSRSPSPNVLVVDHSTLNHRIDRLPTGLPLWLPKADVCSDTDSVAGVSATCHSSQRCSVAGPATSEISVKTAPPTTTSTASFPYQATPASSRRHSCGSLLGVSTVFGGNRHHRRKRKRNDCYAYRHSSTLKWTKESIYWLKLWSQHRRARRSRHRPLSLADDEDDDQNEQDKRNSVIVSKATVSALRYSYPYSFPRTAPVTDYQSDLPVDNQRCSSPSSSLTTLLGDKNTAKCCQLDGIDDKSRHSSSDSNIVSCPPKIGRYRFRRRRFNDDDFDETKCQINDNQSVCLSTIMEILPLVLLLTMGVVISTTCAKYTFQSTANAGHAMRLADTNRTSTSTNVGSAGHHQQTDESDHLQAMMMADEEVSDSGPRPLFSGFRAAPPVVASPSQPSTTQQQQQLFAQLAHQYSAMQLRWLSNATVTCNDGTRAGYYIRSSPTGSRRWLIFLEGGWYCMSKTACDQRWYKMRDFMTSFRWRQYKTFSGILSSSQTVNPYWWNANHVFIPYCSSDIWSGDQPAPPTEMAFLGSRIIDAVIGELIDNPVHRFLDAKFVLLAGSSAGGAGVMINLDRVAKIIADAGSSADVRGLADSGWIMDNEPPAFDVSVQYHHHQQKPTKMVPCPGGDFNANCSPTETIKGAYKLWNSRVPEACAQRFPNEPWRCYFGYRLYPTLKTPLFVVQFQYDEFQIYMDGMTSRALNDMEKMRYIRTLSEQMTNTLVNVSAVFAPSCMAHILLTKLDWHKVSIRGVTLPEALNCWEQTPVNNAHRQQYHHHHHHRFNHQYSPPKPWLYKPQQQIYNMHHSPSQYPVDDQNELSQFYSPSNNQNSNNNLLNYLARGGNSSSPYYAHQEYAKQEVTVENSPRVWKLDDAPGARSPNSIPTTNNRTVVSSPSQSTSQPVPGTKKRKKRKRRKHHHRKAATPTPVPDDSKMIQNDGGSGGNSGGASAYLLQSYYHHPEAKRFRPWNGNPDPHQPYRSCQFRLIDSHQYPERNHECPLLQFHQNSINSNKPYMERR